MSAMSASANKSDRRTVSRNGGTYRAAGQEFELEFVPVKNVRVELGTSTYHHIRSVAGFEDRRQMSWGVALDLRYRFLERARSPFSFTFAVEQHASRIDENSATRVRSYGTEFTAAFDRELVPNVVLAAALQPDLPAGMDPQRRYPGCRAGIHHWRPRGA